MSEPAESAPAVAEPVQLAVTKDKSPPVADRAAPAPVRKTSGKWKWGLLGLTGAAVAAVAIAWLVGQRQVAGSGPAAAEPAVTGPVELAPGMKLIDKRDVPAEPAAPVAAPVPVPTPSQEGGAPEIGSVSPAMPEGPARAAEPVIEPPEPPGPVPAPEKKTGAKPKASNQHDEIRRQKEALKQQLGL